jgi:hypothetical protein
MLSFVDLAFKLCGTFKSFLDFIVLMMFSSLSFRVLLNLSFNLFTLQSFWRLDLFDVPNVFYICSFILRVSGPRVLREFSLL